MKRFNQLGGFLALALTVLVAALPAMAAPVDNINDQTINGEWRFQQDVTFQDTLKAQGPFKIRYWNGSDYLFESVGESAPAMFYEDFLSSNSTFPAMPGTTLTSKFNFVRNSTGNGAVTMVASTPPGLARLSLNGSSGVQSAALLWADNLALDLSKGIIWEARIAVSNLPDYSGSASWGLMGNNTNPDPQANGWFALFDIGGSAMDNASLNATTQDGVIHTNSSTGITVAGAFKTYRIETYDNYQVRYFVDGAEVAASSAPTWGTRGGRLFVQPYFNVSTPSAATNALSSNGTIDLDYLRIWQKSR